MRKRPQENAGAESERLMNQRTVFHYLRASDVFQDLEKEEVEAIHNAVPMARCPRGTVFYAPGDQGERLFILKEGKVALYRLSTDGRKLVVGTLEPGTVFGEMMLVAQGMQDCFAEAVEDALVCTFSRGDMERLVRQHPEVGLRLLEVMGRRVGQLEDQLELVAYATVRQRLAHLLLKLAPPAPSPREVRGYTHEDLGDLIGALRQTVTQELGRLQTDGLVEVERKRIRLLDPEGLRAILAG